MVNRRPTNLLVACAVAALPGLAFRLLVRFSSGGGDGLCGFVPTLGLLGLVIATTLIFTLRGARLGEGPALLRIAPLALWLAGLVPMVS